METQLGMRSGMRYPLSLAHQGNPLLSWMGCPPAPQIWRKASLLLETAGIVYR